MDSVAGASVIDDAPASAAIEDPAHGQRHALGDALVRTARLHPSHGVTYINEGAAWDFQSYPALLEEASRILSGLRQTNLAPGDPVLFQFTDNRDFIPAFWACVLGGFVPVPLS